MSWLSIVALGSLSLIACKKNVDPTSFDAGATAAPVVAAPTPDPAAAPSAPAAADSAAPLASLTPPATPPPAAAQNKPKTTVANPNLPECAKARQFCNHPAAGTDTAIQKLCTENKQACFAKGGKL